MRISRKVQQFTESVIREMTRHALELGAVNLAQGFPDFSAPEEIKLAAQQAIAEDINQYTITWGARDFRRAIAESFARWQGVAIDPEREVAVCCGSTEAMMATLLGLADPGEEIIVFEPFYENYGPDVILSDTVMRYVTLYPPQSDAPSDPKSDWWFDPAELRAAFSARTRAIIINTPHNPTGKVFTREELELVRDLCVEFDALCITDEIYEHILYEGAQHISPMAIEGMRERSIAINSLSKTYSVTGWRVGWAIAAPELCTGIRKVHDFMTVNAAAPLQAAGITALAMPPEYYAELSAHYTERRDLLVGALRAAGFHAWTPRGAYYVMTDISGFGAASDREFAMQMVREFGVAAVPGSSFYRPGRGGSQQVRFTFCKKIETLERAAANLRAMAQRLQTATVARS